MHWGLKVFLGLVRLWQSRASGVAQRDPQGRCGRPPGPDLCCGENPACFLDARDIECRRPTL